MTGHQAAHPSPHVRYKMTGSVAAHDGVRQCSGRLVQILHEARRRGVSFCIVLDFRNDRRSRAIFGVAEIFEGPHYGSIFGTLTVALIGGGAAGPWAAGVIHDLTGSYRLAFLLAILCCAVSTIAIWIAAPRKVRRVPGTALKA